MFSGSRLQGLGAQVENEDGPPPPTGLVQWLFPSFPKHTPVDISVVFSVPKKSALAPHEAAYVWLKWKALEPWNYIKAISKLVIIGEYKREGDV